MRLLKKELEKLENLKFELKSIYEKNDYDYVIMTNRIIVERNKNILPKVKDNHWIGFCSYRELWSNTFQIIIIQVMPEGRMNNQIL